MKRLLLLLTFCFFSLFPAIARADILEIVPSVTPSVAPTATPVPIVTPTPSIAFTPSPTVSVTPLPTAQPTLIYTSQPTTVAVVQSSAIAPTSPLPTPSHGVLGTQVTRKKPITASTTPAETLVNVLPHAALDFSLLPFGYAQGTAQGYTYPSRHLSAQVSTSLLRISGLLFLLCLLLVAGSRLNTKYAFTQKIYQRANVLKDFS